MGYRVEDRLEDFEFHDAWLTLDRFDSGALTVSADHVNVHKAAGYGTLEHDMELDRAKITFEDFCAMSFEPGRAWKTDPEGSSYTDDPLIVYRDGEAEETILGELRNGISVYALGKNADGRYFIEGCGIEPFFTMGFWARSVVVEWDGYRKKAWYEVHRQCRREAVLDTPDGRGHVNVRINYHYEDVCYQGMLEKAPLVVAGVEYEGEAFWGRGKDEATALAALQDQLPRDVFLTLT